MNSGQSLVAERSGGRKIILLALAILAAGASLAFSAISLSDPEDVAIASALGQVGDPHTDDEKTALVAPRSTKAVDAFKASLKGQAPYFPGLSPTGKVLDSVQYEAVKNPGIILVVTDTLRPDHLGAYGYQSDTSPFIDTLAHAGVSYVNHVSNSSWTKTSMASLLTGLYPSRHGVREVTARLDKSFVTLGEAFKSAGFATGAVIANKIAGSRYGLSQGFDFVAEPKTHFGGKPPHAGQALATAIRWLDDVDDKPFFLMILLFDAHDPYYPPYELRQKYCADCGNNIITTPQREYKGKGPTAKQIADMRALYDGEIRFIDNQLRNFYGLLNQLGVLDRTTLALLSDHGEAFGEHGVFEHAFHMWDEVVRTPLILQGAGVRSQGFVTTPTSHIDVYPTLLKLGGVNIPDSSQGDPLVWNQGEPGLDPDRIMITEVEMYGIHRLAVRDLNHKLVYHSPLKTETFSQFYQDLDYYPSVAKGKPRWELFDLIKDPFEKNNAHGQRSGEAAHLIRAIETYRRTGGLEDFSSSQEISQELLDDLKSLGYVH